MIGKFCMFLILILFNYTSSSQVPSDKYQFIFINYSTSIPSKPYSRILLYTEGSISSYYDTIATVKHKISQNDFASLRNIILQPSRSSNDTLLKNDNLFELHVHDRAENRILLTRSITMTRQIIQDIRKQQTLVEGQRLSDILQVLFDRVYYENFLYKRSD